MTSCGEGRTCGPTCDTSSEAQALSMSVRGKTIRGRRFLFIMVSCPVCRGAHLGVRESMLARLDCSALTLVCANAHMRVGVARERI
ncbi:hypothetical protein LMG27952_00123 [Paraburkholderia hiiakae]|uniref:Uncharacterized protein n=1 Tax=Paraburkholderia hiiakae TaxID=1081782 RepID=A0ABM8N8F4_9BURK|nr:hypothetical protein LMG27952_00123 [Paraburkholderia hiiakae]